MSEKDILLELKRTFKKSNVFDVDADYDDDGENIKTLVLYWKKPSRPPVDIDAVWQLKHVQVLTFENFPYSSFSNDNDGDYYSYFYHYGPLMEIGNFADTLKELTLENCYKLRTLPSEVVVLLVNLTSLTICGSLLECLPPEIGTNLVNLQKLELKRIKKLKSIPKEIGSLGNLKILKLLKNMCLKSIPPEIFDLQCLLELEWSFFDVIPSEIYKLECLQILKMAQNSRSRHLPPGISKLRNLIKLEISDFHNLKDLPQEIGSLEKLEELEISQCYNLSWLPLEIGDLKNLQRLKVIDCCNLNYLPSTICKLENLQDYTFNNFDGFARFPLESNIWKSLRKVHNANTFSSVPAKEDIMLKCINCENLQELEIDSCRSLVKLPEEIGNLKYLRRLIIRECNNLEGLPPGIGNLESLEEMTIKSSSLKYLPSEIGQLENLRQLIFASVCYLFIPLEVSNLEKLQVFEGIYYGCLERLSFVINRLKYLQRLDIQYGFLHHCETPSDVVFEGKLAITLENMIFQGCRSTDLEDFLQRVVSEDQLLSQFSLLLSQKIQTISFEFYHARHANKTINQEVFLKLLQKNPKLAKISLCKDDDLKYFTPDMLHMIYFNRFGRSMNPDDARSPKLPMLLEGIKTKIDQNKDESKGKVQFDAGMTNASVVYYILHELALSMLFEREYR